MRQRHLSEVEITEYADGELAPARLSPVEAHLRTCDHCAARLAQCRRATAVVGRLPAASPPSDLSQRVAARLAAEPARALDCRAVAPLLHHQVDRCLSPLAAVALDRHLAGCARCRAELVALSRTAALVRSLTPVAAPARVRRAVAEAMGGHLPAPRWPTWLRPALATASVAAVAALALLVRPAVQPASTVAPVQSLVVAQQPATPAPELPLTRGPAVSAASEVQRPQPVGQATQVAALGEPESQPVSARPSHAGAEAVARTVAVAAPTVARRTRPQAALVVAAAPAVGGDEVAAPRAVQTLKRVAESASAAREARRAMELAAERFATLGSEEALLRLPEAASPAAAPVGAGGDDWTRAAPPARQPETGSRPTRDSAADPGRAWMVTQAGSGSVV